MDWVADQNPYFVSLVLEGEIHCPEPASLLWEGPLRSKAVSGGQNWTRGVGSSVEETVSGLSPELWEPPPCLSTYTWPSCPWVTLHFAATVIILKPRSDHDKIHILHHTSTTPPSPPSPPPSHLQSLGGSPEPRGDEPSSCTQDWPWPWPPQPHPITPQLTGLAFLTTVPPFAKTPVHTLCPPPGTLFPPFFPTLVLTHPSALSLRATSSGKFSVTSLARSHHSSTSLLGSRSWFLWHRARMPFSFINVNICLGCRLHGGLVVKTLHFQCRGRGALLMQGLWVRSLVRELRSHNAMQHSQE